jgi:hypothetical protein
MGIPQTIFAVRDRYAELLGNLSIEGADQPLVTPSPVVAIVEIYNLLKPEIDTLDDGGLEVLAGAASVIMANRYHDLDKEAAVLYGKAFARLSYEPETPAPPADEE